MGETDHVTLPPPHTHTQSAAIRVGRQSHHTSTELLQLLNGTATSTFIPSHTERIWCELGIISTEMSWDESCERLFIFLVPHICCPTLSQQRWRTLPILYGHTWETRQLRTQRNTLEDTALGRHSHTARLQFKWRLHVKYIWKATETQLFYHCHFRPYSWAFNISTSFCWTINYIQRHRTCMRSNKLSRVTTSVQGQFTRAYTDQQQLNYRSFHNCWQFTSLYIVNVVLLSVVDATATKRTNRLHCVHIT